MASLLIAGAGMAIGAYFQYPLLGYAIGSALGSYLFSEKIKNKSEGPRIEDLTVQSSTFGAPIPQVYGTMRVAGNLIWSTGLIEHRDQETETTGGKGGGGSVQNTTITYTYSTSIAIGLCKGPIVGIRKIWADQKLIYKRDQEEDSGSPPPDSHGVEDANPYFPPDAIYLGTATQTADPTMEAVEGSGRVPAYRDLAYVVWEDLPLGDFGNRVPNFTFEVVVGGASSGVPDDEVIAEVAETYSSSATNPMGIIDPIYGYFWFLAPKKNKLYAVDPINGGIVRLVELELGYDGAEYFAFIPGYQQQQQIIDITPPPPYEPPPYTLTTRENQEDSSDTLLQDSYIVPPMFFIHNGIPGILDDKNACFVGLEGNLIDMGSYDFYGSGNTFWLRTGTGSPGPIAVQTLDELNPFGTLKAWQVTGPQIIVYPSSLGTVDGIHARSPVLRSSDYTPGYGQRFDAPYSQVPSGYQDKVYKIEQLANTYVVMGIFGTFNLVEGMIEHRYTTNAYPFGDFEIGGYDAKRQLIYFYLTPTGGGNSQIWAIDMSAWDRTLFLLFDLGQDYNIGTTNGAFFYHPETDKLWVYCYCSLDGSSNQWLASFDPDTGTRIKKIAKLRGIHVYDMLTPVPGIRNYVMGLHYYQLSDPTTIARVYLEDYVDETNPTLASVVADICQQCGLTSGQYDVTDLASVTVNGFTVSRQASGRSLLESLQTAYLFDGVETDGKVKFYLRDNTSIATIDQDDLAAHDAGGEVPPLYELTRKEELELPQELSINYIAPQLDYEQGTQYARRLITASSEKVTLDAPISLTHSEALQVAEKQLGIVWTERNSLKFQLGPKYAYLNPTDVVTLSTDSAIHTVLLRNTTINPYSIIQCEGVTYDGSVYLNTNVGSGPEHEETIHPVNATIAILLDIPALRDEDNELMYYGAFSGVSTDWRWPGCVLYKSYDNASFSTVGTYLKPATHGTASTILADARYTIWDQGNTVTVYLTSGTLDSKSEAEVLNGENLAILGKELIQWTTATLTATNTYVLSNLLRGRLGTQWATGTHSTGETFVALNKSSIYKIKLASTDLNADLFWRAPSIGETFNNSYPQNLVNRGVVLKPHAPVHLTGAWNSNVYDLNAELDLQWIRCNRLFWQWRDYNDVPKSEGVTPYYVLEIKQYYVGSTYVESWLIFDDTDMLTTESATYTYADLLGMGFDLDRALVFRVAQWSDTVGMGEFSEPLSITVPWAP